MPTSNVVTVASGTGFAVNVAGLNLSTNLALKDFSVLKNGVPDSIASYTKASATQVNYAGVSLTAATLEFRRVTSTSVITTAQFGTRIRSQDWNDELDRISRRAEEYALNGVGAGSVVSVALPQNDPFGSLWATDIVFPPNRKVVYDKILTLADRASPTFTGIVTLPGVLDTDNSLAAATTLFVKNNLIPYAPLASPTFSGTPVLPGATTGITQTLTDSTTKLATTAFVAGNIAVLAPLASPTFTGTPTLPTGTIATTQVYTDNTTKIATTAFIKTHQAWQTVTLPGSWTNVGGFQVYQYRVRNDGNIELRGLAQSNTITWAAGSNNNIFTIPSYSASGVFTYIGWMYNNGAGTYSIIRIDVSTTGVVQLNPAIAITATTALFEISGTILL